MPCRFIPAPCKSPRGFLSLSVKLYACFKQMPRLDLSAASLVLCSFFALLCPACDQGLSPGTSVRQIPVYGISGTVHFKNWPPADSIVDLRVVSFKTFPSQDILSEVLKGKAAYTETLQPYGADSIPYTLVLSRLPPGAFAYTVVAQQFGQNITADWRAVGEYHAAGDTSHPGSITVAADSILTGIDIVVDFRQPPPLP